MEETRTLPTARRSTAGRRFPADPPRVEEIVAVMKTAGELPDAMRLRALIVIIWRAGLRIRVAPGVARGSDLAKRSVFGQKKTPLLRGFH